MVTAIVRSHHRSHCYSHDYSHDCSHWPHLCVTVSQPSLQPSLQPLAAAMCHCIATIGRSHVLLYHSYWPQPFRSHWATAIIAARLPLAGGPSTAECSIKNSLE